MQRGVSFGAVQGDFIGEKRKHSFPPFCDDDFMKKKRGFRFHFYRNFYDSINQNWFIFKF